MTSPRTRRCQDLLDTFRGLSVQQQPRQGTKLQFSGTEGRDVYNCTAPFTWHGEQVIAARVESPGMTNARRSSSLLSGIWFLGASLRSAGL